MNEDTEFREHILYNTVASENFRKGLVTGKAEGRMEGLAEGEARGKVEGFAEALHNVAERLKKAGMPDEQIARVIRTSQTGE